ncbi:MAG: DUF655 domain-containing protein [Promethearchaeia archaeon]
MERRDRMRRRPPQRRPYQKKPRKKKQFIKKSRPVVILDVLPHGHPDDERPSWARTPIAQVLTPEDFVLYEVKLYDKNVKLNIQERKTYEQFVKEGKLKDVLRKINYDDLTTTAKALLLPILEEEVKNYEEMFVNFFNNSTSITPRMHALKLIPGIGNKHMWQILEEREKKKFDSFEEISKRTSVSNPAKQLAQRILKELQRDVKYYLFSKTQKYE